MNFQFDRPVLADVCTPARSYVVPQSAGSRYYTHFECLRNVETISFAATCLTVERERL